MKNEETLNALSGKKDKVSDLKERIESKLITASVEIVRRVLLFITDKDFL